MTRYVYLPVDAPVPFVVKVPVEDLPPSLFPPGWPDDEADLQ